jgi:Catechol dioxygenase N terminus
MRTTALDKSEPLARIVPDALAAIHEVLERNRVTEEEWHAVLAFLTEVGKADEFILLSEHPGGARFHRP